jgi:hypothetical protein
VVPPESLRESTPHACTVCTGDALFENLGLSEDELDALMSGECPSCDGTGIAYRHPDPASAAR